MQLILNGYLMFLKIFSISNFKFPTLDGKFNSTKVFFEITKLFLFDSTKLQACYKFPFLNSLTFSIFLFYKLKILGLQISFEGKILCNVI